MSLYENQFSAWGGMQKRSRTCCCCAPTVLGQGTLQILLAQEFILFSWNLSPCSGHHSNGQQQTQDSVAITYSGA